MHSLQLTDLSVDNNQPNADLVEFLRLKFEFAFLRKLLPKSGVINSDLRVYLVRILWSAQKLSNLRAT
jgi:hypothetical protein